MGRSPLRIDSVDLAVPIVVQCHRDGDTNYHLYIPWWSRLLMRVALRLSWRLARRVKAGH